LLLLAIAAPPAAAEPGNGSEHGFTVSHAVDVKAEPFVAWRTMTSHVDQWWSKDHTWSGDAANLYLKVERNGCFCERLPNAGEVEHLRVIFFRRGSEIRFDGALGPLQAMPVTGRMIWKIEETEDGSRITFTYHVMGIPGTGLDDIAPAVDGVIGEQIGNLARRLNWNK
jgi:hypothetical protein